MSRRQANRRLPGPLGKPVNVRWRKPSLLEDEQETAAANAAAVRAAIGEVMSKVPLLFDHLEIPRTGDTAVDFEALALALAIEFVPGFRIAAPNAKGRGRSKIDPRQQLQLLVDAEDARRKYNLPNSDSRIAGALRRKPPYSRYKNKGMLQNKLSRARKLLQGYSPDKVRDLLALFAAAEASGVTKK